jgi:hypothetical protein
VARVGGKSAAAPLVNFDHIVRVEIDRDEELTLCATLDKGRVL